MSGIQNLLLAGGTQILYMGDLTVSNDLPGVDSGYFSGFGGSFSETLDTVGVTLTRLTSSDSVGPYNVLQTSAPLLTTAEGANTPAIKVSIDGSVETFVPIWDYDSERDTWTWSMYFSGGIYGDATQDPWGLSSKGGQTLTVIVRAA